MAKIAKESYIVNEVSWAIKICDWVTKYSIYVAIFLMPIFFLPWTADVLDFNFVYIYYIIICFIKKYVKFKFTQ